MEEHIRLRQERLQGMARPKEPRSTAAEEERKGL